MPLETDLHKILQRGKTVLNLSVGIVSHIDNKEYTVISVLSDYPGFYAGSQFELGDTYCQDVATHREIMTYTDVARITGMLKHPVYLSYQLRAYIGAPIILDGQFWGTLNFSSRQPRKAFSDEEVCLVGSLSCEAATVILDQGNV